MAGHTTEAFRWAERDVVTWKGLPQGLQIAQTRPAFGLLTASVIRGASHHYVLGAELRWATVYRRCAKGRPNSPLSLLYYTRRLYVVNRARRTIRPRRPSRFPPRVPSFPGVLVSADLIIVVTFLSTAMLLIIGIRQSDDRLRHGRARNQIRRKHSMGVGVAFRRCIRPGRTQRRSARRGGPLAGETIFEAAGARSRK